MRFWRGLYTRVIVALGISGVTSQKGDQLDLSHTPEIEPTHNYRSNWQSLAVVFIDLAVLQAITSKLVTLV